MRLCRIGVLASVGLAAVLTVVPGTAASTSVHTNLSPSGSHAIQASAVLPFDLLHTHDTSTANTDLLVERRFQDRANRGSPRSTESTPPTTAAPVSPPTTAKPVTPSTTVRAAAPVRTVRAAAPVRTVSRPTPPTTAAPAPPQQPMSGAWACILQHESGGNYRDNTGNGYYGAYQFSISTWNSMGTGYSRADLAPPGVQDDAARRLQARSGWGQWPRSSRLCGLR